MLSMKLAIFQSLVIFPILLHSLLPLTETAYALTFLAQVKP